MDMWSHLLSKSKPSPFIADVGPARMSEPMQRLVIASATAVAEPIAKPVGEIVARPVPVTAPTLPDGYEAIAERIGAGHLVANVKAARERDAAAVAAEELRVRCLAALSELGLRTYDEHTVAAYLKTVYGATPFGWRALRERDNPSVDGGGRPWRQLGDYFNARTTGWESMYLASPGKAQPMRIIGGWDAALYSKPIPLPVLLTVENIQHRLPEACFFISDEAQRMTQPVDPFLMVLVGNERYIVERWDEPNFRG